MISVRALVGVLMIVLLFVAAFIGAVRLMGWKEALIAFGATAGLVAFVALASWLIDPEGWLE